MLLLVVLQPRSRRVAPNGVENTSSVGGTTSSGGTRTTGGASSNAGSSNVAGASDTGGLGNGGSASSTGGTGAGGAATSGATATGGSHAVGGTGVGGTGGTVTTFRCGQPRTAMRLASTAMLHAGQRCSSRISTATAKRTCAAAHGRGSSAVCQQARNLPRLSGPTNSVTRTAGNRTCPMAPRCRRPI